MSHSDMCSPHDLFESAFGISQLTIGPEAPIFSNFDKEKFDNLQVIIDGLDETLTDLNENEHLDYDTFFFEVTYAFFKALFEYSNLRPTASGDDPSVFYYIDALATMDFIPIIEKLQEKNRDIISDDVLDRYRAHPIPPGDPDMAFWKGFWPAIKPKTSHILFLFQSKYKQNLKKKLESEDDTDKVTQVLELVLLVNVFTFYNSLENTFKGRRKWEAYTRDLNLDNLHLDKITKNKIEVMKTFTTEDSAYNKVKTNYQDWETMYVYKSQAAKRKGRAQGVRNKRVRKTGFNDFANFLGVVEEQLDADEAKIRTKNAENVKKIIDNPTNPFNAIKLGFASAKRNPFLKLLLDEFVKGAFVDDEVDQLKDSFQSFLIEIFKKPYKDIIRLNENIKATPGLKFTNFKLLSTKGISFEGMFDMEMERKEQEHARDLLRKEEEMREKNILIDNFTKLANSFIKTLEAEDLNTVEINRSVRSFCNFTTKNKLKLKPLKMELSLDSLLKNLKNQKKALSSGREILALAQKFAKCLQDIENENTMDTSSSEEDEGEPRSSEIIDLTSGSDLELLQAAEAMESGDEETQPRSEVSEYESGSESPSLV